MSKSIRTKKKFVGIKTMATGRIVRSINAVAVGCTRSHVFDITMPYLIRIFRKLDAFEFLASVFIEEAYFDPGCVLGEQSEVGALTIPGCALAVWTTFMHLAHVNHLSKLSEGN